MKNIKIDVSEETWQDMKNIASCIGTTASAVLTQFVNDLTCSSDSGGSDERSLASEWFFRSEYNFRLK